ncbi:MAG: hypothetical protein Tsb009_25730 [Planctomycetaceae bacterium]
MSISFQCDSCGKNFTVDDSLAGRKAKCKNCQSPIVVPSPEVEEAIPVAPLIEEDEPVMAAVVEPEVVDDGIISFDCEFCGTTMRVRADLAGKTGKCKNCQASITVPGGDDDGFDFEEEDDDIFADPAPSQSLSKSSGGGGLAAKKQLSSIQRMVDAGRYVEATRALKSIQGKAGNHPAYHYLNGLAYAGLGNYPHALDSLSRAASGGMRTPELYAAKGEAELELGHYTSAIDSLDTALDLAGTDVPDYMANLAKAYDGARMRQDARATWNALSQISPNHPALLERKRRRQERRERKHERDVQDAMLQMQKEQRASDTACWICIILRCLLECL